MSGSGIPVWLVLLCVIAALILVAVGSIWLANRTMPEVGKEHNSTLSPFITVVGLMYGALLGFTVVAAWQQYSSAGITVSDEASTLTTMYRQTVAMPQPEQTQLRQLLRRYTSAVAGPEWKTQGRGRTSDTARGAVTEMYRVIGTQPTSVASSPITGEFLNQLTALSSDRNRRIIDAKPRIPWLLWSGLIFGGTVIVAFTGFLRLGSTIGHVIVSSTIAALLGLMLCTAFALDHPFGNERGITSEPFQHALEVFDAVDRGP